MTKQIEDLKVGDFIYMFTNSDCNQYYYKILILSNPIYDGYLWSCKALTFFHFHKRFQNEISIFHFGSKFGHYKFL